MSDLSMYLLGVNDGAEEATHPWCRTVPARNMLLTSRGGMLAKGEKWNHFEGETLHLDAVEK